MKAIDSATKTTGKEGKIVAAGMGAVGLYLRPDRASLAMVQGLHKANLKCFSVYEKGFPTTGSYFTAAQGTGDAKKAVLFAAKIGQPKGKEIFFAVDFDAEAGDMAG